MINNHNYLFLWLLAALLLAGPLYGQDPEMVWARQRGGPQFDVGMGVTADLQGNVYYCGFFEGQADFEPEGQGAKFSAKNRDIFIAKQTPEGRHLWTKQIGSGATNQAFAVKTDIRGNVYAAGQVGGKALFDTIEVQTNGSEDAFVARLDSMGNFIWVRHLGGRAQDIAYALDLDQEGYVYIAGTFNDRFQIDTVEYVARGYTDIFLAKLDPQGNFVWVKTYGSDNKTSGDLCTSIAVDKDKNIYSVGHFRQSVMHLNPNMPFEDTLSTQSLNETFISKLDSMGNLVWGKSLRSASASASSFCYGVRTDRSGNVFLGGSFYGMVDFNVRGNQNYFMTAGSGQAFAAKLEPNGELTWAKSIAMTGMPRSIDVDHKGALYLLGNYSRTANLNPGGQPADTFMVTSAGSSDMFLLKLDPAGRFEWGKSIGGTQSEYPFAVFVDQKKSVYATGYFGGYTVFDSSLADARFQEFGASDIFLLKIIQSCKDTSLLTLEVTLCEDAYWFNGQVYDSSGDYSSTFMNEAGCDSMLHLRLTLNGHVDKPIIGVNGFVLRTDQAYDYYQWFLDGQAIPGTNSRILEVAENGWYSVVAGNARDCQDTSLAYEVRNKSSIPSVGSNNTISLYPNPATDRIHIPLPAASRARITGIDGKSTDIRFRDYIPVAVFPPGLYHISLYDKDGHLLGRGRFVKH